MFGKENEDTARLPRYTGIGAQFQCLQGYHKNCNVLKDKIRSPVFRRIRPKIPVFGIIRA